MSLHSFTAENGLIGSRLDRARADPHAVEYMDQRPSVQDYTDYRGYLRDMVQHLKATTRSFSYRAFAKRGGFSSVGYLKHVIDGERNLSMASVTKVAKGLGLSEQEASAFELLVMLHQAATDEAKTRLLRRLRATKLRRQLKEDEFELYSSWWVVPIRELLTMADAPRSDAEIAQRLFPTIKRNEVKQALSLLERLGLIERNVEHGGLTVRRGTLETAASVKSLAVRNYHRDMLQRAMEALESVPTNERNVTSLTVKLTPSDYQAVCQKISETQDEILSLLDASDPNASEADVYNIACSVVPVTRRTEK